MPEDISVVGFDDIPGAAFSTPGLTTVRQPLVRMGQIAARTLIDELEGRSDHVPEIAIEPEFVVRQSTCTASPRSVNPKGPPKTVRKSAISVST